MNMDKEMQDEYDRLMKVADALAMLPEEDEGRLSFLETDAVALLRKMKQEVERLEALIPKRPPVLPLNVWFMFDNHTFRKINVDAPDDGLFAQIRDAFDEDGCGAVFVRNAQDQPLPNEMGLSANYSKNGYKVLDYEITGWIKRLRAFIEKARKEPT